MLQGRTYYSGGVKDEMADAIREFNEYIRQDSRVDVLALPFRDGVNIITRRWPHIPKLPPERSPPPFCTM